MSISPSCLFGVIKLARKKHGRTEENSDFVFERKPWIAYKKGLLLITLVSVLFGLWVAYQLFTQHAEIKHIILYGLGAAGSVWLVFFAMNLFHKVVRGGN